MAAMCALHLLDTGCVLCFEHAHVCTSAWRRCLVFRPLTSSIALIQNFMCFTPYVTNMPAPSDMNWLNTTPYTCRKQYSITDVQSVYGKTTA
jgi:hypothetical protein